VTHRVLIAGSGVAAVEAVLALRHLVGHRCAIDLIAPAHALEHRPASVAAPFGLGLVPPLDLAALARRYDVALIEDALSGVDVAEQHVRLASGRDRGYDHLVIAVGAIAEPPLRGALTFRGPDDVAMVEWVMAEIARGHRRQLVIVVPPHATWSLPAYEVAIMAALEMHGLRDATVTVVTPERDPLWIFGEAAAAALRELLSEREIALRTQARASHVTDKVLWLESGEAFIGDAVICLPRLVGPRIEGLPSDDEGFLPTDAHGYVMGARGVLAAGDVTTFPVKQGGLATQQADAVAATIAHELDARVEAEPFVPRLRGLLLTGGAPLYLWAELDAAGHPHRAGTRSKHLAGQVSSRALWWPPAKVAGRFLAPYLATARPPSVGQRPLVDLVAKPSGADPVEREAALELALLVADEDAAAGDFAQAVNALDAAAALGGGMLPADYVERRERWLAELTPAGS
jgi:sulfide:quinone oxidoreductase